MVAVGWCVEGADWEGAKELILYLDYVCEQVYKFVKTH